MAAQGLAQIFLQAVQTAYSIVISDSKFYTAAQTLMPAGTVLQFAGASAPSGFLLCDGSAVSRTTYSNLFAAISTTYGTGDGSTTFNLPDCRGVFIRGAGTSGKLTNANGAAFAATLGTYQNDKMQGHNHNVRINGALVYQGSTAGSGANSFNNASGQNNGQLESALDLYTDGTNGAPRTGTETNPANLALNYIIAT